jgi:hypothetical protein
MNQMTIKQAIKKIVSQWDTIYKNKEKNYSRNSYLNTPCIVVAISDKSEAYEVDEELIGISQDGNIVWAYASGCSCWDGDYTEETKPTVKEFELVHDHLPEDWEAMIIKFAETGEVQNF